jgi:hypothetical protein
METNSQFGLGVNCLSHLLAFKVGLEEAWSQAGETHSSRLTISTISIQSDDELRLHWPPRSKFDELEAALDTPIGP